MDDCLWYNRWPVRGLACGSQWWGPSRLQTNRTKGPGAPDAIQRVRGHRFECCVACLPSRVSVKRNWQGQAHDKSRSRIAGQRYGRRMRRPCARKPAQTPLSVAVAFWLATGVHGGYNGRC